MSPLKFILLGDVSQYVTQAMITHSKNSGFQLLLVNFLLLYLLFFSRFLVTGNSFHAIQPIPEFLFVRASASIVSITRHLWHLWISTFIVVRLLNCICNLSCNLCVLVETLAQTNFVGFGLHKVTLRFYMTRNVK
jgi:hypothetical protein